MINKGMWPTSHITAFVPTTENWYPSFDLYSGDVKETQLVRVHLMYNKTLAKIVVSGADDFCMERYIPLSESFPLSEAVAVFVAILSEPPVTRSTLTLLGLEES